MAIDLPCLPRATQYEPFDVVIGTVHRSPFGGGAVPIDRTGQRFGMKVTVPVLDADCASTLLAMLSRGRKTPVRLKLAPGLVSNADAERPYGSVVVDGAGQLGTALDLKGLTPQVVLRDGQWANLMISGQAYLYQVAADATAGEDGKVEASLWPPIRRAAADEDGVEFADPVIEGYAVIESRGAAGRIGDHAVVRGIGFTIEEAE